MCLRVSLSFEMAAEAWMKYRAATLAVAGCDERRCSPGGAASTEAADVVRACTSHARTCFGSDDAHQYAVVRDDEGRSDVDANGSDVISDDGATESDEKVGCHVVLYCSSCTHVRTHRRRREQSCWLLPTVSTVELLFSSMVLRLILFSNSV